jgi:acetyl/propionyl-CoA carboxylase alpha subunit
MRKTIRLDGNRHEVTLALHGAAFRVGEGERAIEGMRRWDGARLSLEIAGERTQAHVVRAAGGRLEVWIDSERHVIEEEGRATGGRSGGGDDDVLVTPMPAKVVRVNVAPGDAVTEGQTLVVVESMKMELGLTALRDGVVATVDATPGVLVAAGAVLVALVPAATQEAK